MKRSCLIVLALAVSLSACARASQNQASPAQPAPANQAPAETYAQKPTAAPTVEIPTKQLEKGLFQAVNDARKQNGLKPLAFSVGLTKSAREHTNTMSNGSFLSTRLAGEQSVLDRMTAAGVNSKMIGENVLRLGAAPDQVVSTTVSTWLAREANRKNLLGAGFTKTGIAITRGSEGDYYITEDFAQ